jgi:DNA-binding transcriptional LysR family regulator
MPRASLSDILVFMAVIEAGTLIDGGRAVGLTRSAAGKALGRLEDRLGVRLLNRTTRALSLTDEGRAFHERGLLILAAVDEAEASVASAAGAPRGVLRLTVPSAYGRLVILPLLQRYLEAWPGLRAEVSFTDRPLDLVEEGFDLAVRIGGAPPDSRLVSRVVARHAAMLVASPSYLAERGEPADVDALARHDCLVFSSRGRKQGWRIRQADGSLATARGRSRLSLDSAEALRDAAVAGLGLAYLPDFLVAENLAAGRLRQVLPGPDARDVEIVALYPSRRLLEPRVRRFIDLMVEELRR